MNTLVYLYEPLDFVEKGDRLKNFTIGFDSSGAFSKLKKLLLARLEHRYLKVLNTTFKMKVKQL